MTENEGIGSISLTNALKARRMWPGVTTATENSDAAMQQVKKQ